MLSSLSIKWRLLLVGLVCALLTGLSGGAGIWSLNRINNAIVSTTGEIDTSITHQNQLVQQITKFREITSKIQNAEEMAELDTILTDFSILIQEHTENIALKNVYFSEAITDLLIKRRNLFITKSGIEGKQVLNNQSLQQIASLALNIMDNSEFESDVRIKEAFAQVHENIDMLFEASNHATKAVNVAHSLHFTCLNIRLSMLSALSQVDSGYIKQKKKQIIQFKQAAITDLDVLFQKGHQQRISTMLDELMVVVDQTLEARIQCLQDQWPAAVCHGDNKYEDIITEITRSALNILDDTEFGTVLQVEKMKNYILESYKDTDNATSMALHIFKSASAIHININRINAYMQEIFNLGNNDFIRYRIGEIHTLLNNTKQEIDRLPQSGEVWDITKLLVAFRTTADQVSESQERMVILDAEFSEDLKKIFKELEVAEQEVLQVSQTVKQSADLALKQSSSLVSKWQKIEFLLVATAFILAILIALSLSRSVLRQLSALNAGIEIVGKGDLSFKVDTGTGDEIGVLSRAFDRMAANIESSQFALSNAVDEAQTANMAKSEFLANMSHELRTPLNVILGFTQIMERSPGLSEANKEELGIISRSGEHLLGLINDVLNLAKIESGQSTLDIEVFDLHRLLQSIDEMFSDQAKKKRIRFNMEISPQVPQMVSGDAGKIRQILINIIGNSIKFTKEGTVLLVLQIEEPENIVPPTSDIIKLNFAVKDTGVGIAEDKLSSIFDPFVQADHSKNATAGTGLGLAICKKFITLMEGTISADSRAGKGSTFSFKIPVEQTSDKGLGTEQTHERVVALAPDQPEYRILIVEDRLENRMLLRKLLELAGFTVLEAVNGKEGVEAFRKERPDFIWMDIQMPVMNGYEAVKHIKQLPGGKDTPVIAITASALEEQRDMILSAGCDGFVSKPFKADIIFKTMKDQLGLHYLYERLDDIDLTSDKETTADALSPENIIRIPAELLRSLMTAAVALDSKECLELIEQVRPENASGAAAMQQLVDNFQFEELYEIIEDSLKDKKDI